MIVLWRCQDQDEQQECQNIFKMKDRVNDEVPGTIHSLVSVGEDLVGVVVLVGDHLVELTALELHLLFVELVLDDV